MPYSTVDGRYKRWSRRKFVKPIPVERTVADALEDFGNAVHERRVKDADRVREATNRMLGEREPYEPVRPVKIQPDLFDPK
jgi:hypothetical protein